jgi:hypothetical protein
MGSSCTIETAPLAEVWSTVAKGSKEGRGGGGVSVVVNLAAMVQYLRQALYMSHNPHMVIQVEPVFKSSIYPYDFYGVGPGSALCHMQQPISSSICLAETRFLTVSFLDKDFLTVPFLI